MHALPPWRASTKASSVFTRCCQFGAGVVIGIVLMEAAILSGGTNIQYAATFTITAMCTMAAASLKMAE